MPLSGVRLHAIACGPGIETLPQFVSLAVYHRGSTDVCVAGADRRKNEVFYWVVKRRPHSTTDATYHTYGTASTHYIQYRGCLICWESHISELSHRGVHQNGKLIHLIHFPHGDRSHRPYQSHRPYRSHRTPSRWKPKLGIIYKSIAPLCDDLHDCGNPYPNLALTQWVVACVPWLKNAYHGWKHTYNVQHRTICLPTFSTYFHGVTYLVAANICDDTHFQVSISFLLFHWFCPPTTGYFPVLYQ